MSFRKIGEKFHSHPITVSRYLRNPIPHLLHSRLPTTKKRQTETSDTYYSSPSARKQKRLVHHRPSQLFLQKSPRTGNIVVYRAFEVWQGQKAPYLLKAHILALFNGLLYVELECCWLRFWNIYGREEVKSRWPWRSELLLALFEIVAWRFRCRTARGFIGDCMGCNFVQKKYCSERCWWNDEIELLLKCTEICPYTRCRSSIRIHTDSTEIWS